MNINYLSRKFLLSVLLAIIAVWFVILHKILPSQWLWVMMSTVIPFITANAIQDATASHFTLKDTDIPPQLAKMLAITPWERIKALFDTVFCVSLAAVLGASALLYFNIIGNTQWFPVVSAVAIAYNIGNSIGKLK